MQPTPPTVATAQELAERLALDGILLFGIHRAGHQFSATWGSRPEDKVKMAQTAEALEAQVMMGGEVTEDFRDAALAAQSADQLRRDNLKLRNALIEMLDVFDDDRVRHAFEWSMFEITACQVGRQAVRETGPPQDLNRLPAPTGLQVLSREACEAHPLWSVFARYAAAHCLLGPNLEFSCRQFGLFLLGNAYNNSRGLDLVQTEESGLTRAEQADLIQELVKEVDATCHGELDASDVLEPLEMMQQILKLDALQRRSALDRVIAKRLEVTA